MKSLAAPATALLLALANAPSFARADVQELWWNISYIEDANPDGLFPRRVIGVNGTWPPPPIDVQTSEYLIVHALNSVDQPATLHHHGMYFNSTSWMDGAQGVSQCGIPTGSSFTYHVPINSSNQWGTYWVHGHANGQYVDGLRSPLLLHPPKEPNGDLYDEEYTVVMGDWYHQEHSVLFAQFDSVADPGGAEPIPDSALLYFAQNGTYLPPLASTSPTGPTSAVGFNANASLPFTPGKTYRLRLINTAAFAAFYFWIDGHEMQIIEGDGTDTEPFSVDMVQLAVAQRYSVLVRARNDTQGELSNFVVHANMDTSMFDMVPPSLNPNITAQITYNTSTAAPLSSPSTTVPAYIDTPDTLLVPVLPIPALPPATTTLNATFYFDTMSDGTNRAMINGVSYQPPKVPAVLTALTMGENAVDVGDWAGEGGGAPGMGGVMGGNGGSGVYGPFGNSFTVGHLEVLDITIFNADSGKHPFHIHGHKPQLIARSANFSDPSQNLPINNSQVNPMRRDTVAIPSGGSATFRLTVDNPGVWFLHCHIDWHLETGLAAQLIFAPSEMQARASSALSYQSALGLSSSSPQFADLNTTFPAPPYADLNSQCTAQGLPFAGNAAGFNSTTDFKGVPVGPTDQVLGWKPKGILAMTGCVLTAVIGMATVIWYSLGGQQSEAEMEMEARDRHEAKVKRGRLFGLVKPKAA